jgi:8-oxo-dGTP pyrophosphatase MutT (NUDIX family)
MKYERSAGAIIFSRNGDTIEYLLLHYPSKKRGSGGHWDYPKGHVEKGEEIEDTVRREVREETGLENIVLVKGFSESISYIFTTESGKVKKEVVFLLAESHERQVCISSEHTECTWLPYQEALEKLTFNNAKDLLRKADAHVRAYHNG